MAMGTAYIAGGIAAVVILTVVVCRLVRRGIALYIRSLCRHEYPGAEFIKQNRDIYTDIVEMRALTDSDRAYVVQFHNGHEFLLSNPVWMLTNTHEVVRPGVTYEASNVQNILVSRVAELIEPVISGDFDGPGIHLSPLCSHCPFLTRCKKDRKFLSVVQVDELPVGFSRYFLENQNVKTIVQCGMSNKHGAFGFVGVDFCGKAITDPAAISDISAHVCQSAEIVQHALQYKKTPSRRISKKLPNNNV